MQIRKPIRLKGYDYSSEGAYFITICTKNNICIFGNIVDGEMILNEYGSIAYNNWKSIKDHFKDVILDAFAIMPDHIHGIININESIGDRNICFIYNNRQYQKIPVIIGSYKSSVTKQINDTNFSWQKSYYDRIIRNESEFNKIRQYIANNPLMSTFK